jgi:hypothetical protein
MVVDSVDALPLEDDCGFLIKFPLFFYLKHKILEFSDSLVQNVGCTGFLGGHFGDAVFNLQFFSNFIDDFMFLLGEAIVGRPA